MKTMEMKKLINYLQKRQNEEVYKANNARISVCEKYYAKAQAFNEIIDLLKSEVEDKIRKTEKR